MNWLGPVLGIAVLLALGAGLFLSPSFRALLVSEAFKAAMNALVPVILKRKTPEEEAKWRDRIARGQTGEVDKWGREKGHDK